MAGHTSQLAALPDRRIGLLIAPREHGAWGLLLVPLTTGGAVGLLSGGSSLPLMAFTVAALTLLWLRTPVENWLGTGLLRAQTQHERRSVGITIVLLAAVAVSALASLFWDGRHPALVPLGLVAAGAFVGQGLLRKLGRQTRMLSQIVGTLGLTITAPAAYYVVTGELNREAWALWLANFLFAGDQVHFVQLRIHSARLVTGREKLRRRRAFLLGQMLLAADTHISLGVLLFCPALRIGLRAAPGWRTTGFSKAANSRGTRLRLDRTSSCRRLRRAAHRRIPF